MTFEINGVMIILNEDLEYGQMKEKGYINGMGMKIVREVEVSLELYNRLIELYGEK